MPEPWNRRHPVPPELCPYWPPKTQQAQGVIEDVGRPRSVAVFGGQRDHGKGDVLSISTPRSIRPLRIGSGGRKFDKLAKSITPGFSSFDYRWAALNIRKKGASEKVPQRTHNDGLEWSHRVKLTAPARVPAEKGVYTLFERDTWLFVAGTEDLRQSVESQQTIAHANLFEDDLWSPKVERLHWQYVRLPDSKSGYRFGIVRSLVGKWEPVFNIPRGKKAA